MVHEVDQLEQNKLKNCCKQIVGPLFNFHFQLPQSQSSHLWDRWNRRCRRRRSSRNQSSLQRPGWRTVIEGEIVLFCYHFLWVLAPSPKKWLYKNNNLLQLDVPDNGKWQKVVEGFLGLHLLLVQLLHLLNHLFRKHLEFCESLKSLFTSFTFWRNFTRITVRAFFTKK